MCRKLQGCCIACLLVFVSSCWGTNVYWDNGAGTGVWKTATNWNPDQMPGTSDMALVDLSGSHCAVDSSTTAQCNQIWVGYTANPCYLDITGGSLSVLTTAGGGCLIGVSSGGVGIVSLSGGTVSTGGDMSIGQNSGSIGTLNMSGGTWTCGAWLYLPYQGTGRLNVLGGTFTANGIIMTASGIMDVSKGTMALAGDWRTTIATYITNGWIIPYNGSSRGTVNYDYNVTIPGKTAVKASITAGNVYWLGTAMDNLWSTPLNWDIHAAPTTSDVALVNVEGSHCVVDSSVTAVCNQLWVGWTGTSYLDVTGGTASVTTTGGGGCLIGVSSGGNGVLSVSGGTFSAAGDMSIGHLTGSTGTVNMTGGALNCGGYIYLPNESTGRINLNGGTVSCAGLLINANGTIDITTGTLIISGDYRNDIDGHIASGAITAYDGDSRASFNIEYNVSNPGKTTVTASIQDLGKAWNPSPADNHKVTANNVLSWTAGDYADLHTVYLGTLFSDVNTATPTSPCCVSNRQSGTSYTASVNSGTIYYWRIDEIQDGNSLSPWKGNVWRFFTGPIAALEQKSTIVKYESVFVDIGTTASYTSNPYNPDDIKVDMVITQPDATQLTLPCFYVTGSSGDSMWQGRFTPRQSGSYSYVVKVYLNSSLWNTSATRYLTVNTSSTNGFVKKNTSGKYYNFLFDSGNRFRGIGENVASEVPNHSFEHMFQLLDANGCNFARVWWAGPYDNPLEWTIYGLGNYDEAVAANMDRIVNAAEQNHIYLMLTIDNVYDFADAAHGGQWADNPYNSANGGPCSTITAFFNNATAIAQYKKKLRYIAARWGYSCNVAMWEHFNEINAAYVWQGVPMADIVSWHSTMSTYLKSVDTHTHIVTTSVSMTEITGLWAVTNIDFSQAHDYGNQVDLTLLRDRIVTREAATGKPHVVGEFSKVSTEPRLQDQALMAKELRRGNWRGMFSPTPILPLTWWYDYHEEYGHQWVLAVAANFHKEMWKVGTGTITNLTVTGPTSTERYGVAALTEKRWFAWVRNKSTSTINAAMYFTIPNDVYTLLYYNTTTGVYYNSTQKTVTNGRLSWTISSMTADQDIAFYVYPTPH